MGYEVKLFLVEGGSCGQSFTVVNDELHDVFGNAADGFYYYADDEETKVDCNAPTLELNYASVVAMVDLCKPGYSSEVLKLMHNARETNNYIYIGNKPAYYDSYGEVMKEASVEDMVLALEKDIEDGGDSPYRRFITALSLLKGVDKTHYPRAKILMYGY